MRLAVALIVAMLLVGCNRTLRPDPPPKIIRVESKTPVSLCPEGGDECALLRDCYNEPAKEQSYAEAKRLANLRDASLKECSERWTKVRSMQPAEKL